MSDSTKEWLDTTIDATHGASFASVMEMLVQEHLAHENGTEPPAVPMPSSRQPKSGTSEALERIADAIERLADAGGATMAHAGEAAHGAPETRDEAGEPLPEPLPEPVEAEPAPAPEPIEADYAPEPAPAGTGTIESDYAEPAPSGTEPNDADYAPEPVPDNGTCDEEAPAAPPEPSGEASGADGAPDGGTDIPDQDEGAAGDGEESIIKGVPDDVLAYLFPDI